MVESSRGLLSNNIFRDIILELRLYLDEIQMREREEACCCSLEYGTKKEGGLGCVVLTITVPTPGAFQSHEAPDPERTKNPLPLAGDTRRTSMLGGRSSPPNTS